MDSDVEMVKSTSPAPATPPPSASTTDKEARTPNDELPMDVDEPKAKAGETSGFPAALPKDEVGSANDESAESSADVEPPPVPAWTHAELIALLNAAEDLSLNWAACSKMLYSEFKDKRSLDFFSIGECAAKYARLTGESAGKRCSKEMMSWIKRFLEKSVNEQPANEESARSARVKRLFELTNYSLNGKVTDDQVAELIGVDKYYEIAASLDTDPPMEGREKWLEADKLSSMLSRDEWKTIESPNDLLGILRNGTVHDERLWFKHPPKEPSTNMLDLVNKTADAEVPLVEKKAVYVEPTDGEVVKRKRGRPRIHAVKEPPAKQPAPPPLPAAVTASLTPTAAAETPAALPKPIPMDTSRSPSSDVIIYEPDVLPPASPVRLPTAVQQGTPAVIQPANSKAVEDSGVDVEIIEPPAKAEKSPERPAQNDKAVELATAIKAKDTDDAASAGVVAADLSKPARMFQSTQTFLTVHPRRPLQPKRGSQHASPSANVRTRRSSSLSTEKTIEIASASHSPTPLSVGEALAFRPQHTQTEPVNVAKLSEVAVTYGHTTALPPIPEHQPAELTPAKPKEFVASTAMIATATPERRSTMTEKQKADTAAAAEEKQRTKEKKEETPPPHLVPFFVDEQLFYQTMPDVQLVKPDDKEFVISTTSRKSADFRSEWNAEKRGEAGGTNAADTPLTTCPKGPTRGVTLAPATRPTPQGARLIVPTLGTPGIPQYVSPDQKLLLVTAHNLVIAHPKADSFANPMNDDLMADYSKIIKKPIDLKTIRKYIDENRIKTLSELNDFYMLMCMNAINFNDKTRAIHKDAFEMRYFCLQTIQNIRHGTTRNAARTTGRKSTFGRELETPMRGVEHSNGDRSRLFRTTGAQPSAIRKVYVRTGVADQPLQ